MSNLPSLDSATVNNGSRESSEFEFVERKHSPTVSSGLPPPSALPSFPMNPLTSMQPPSTSSVSLTPAAPAVMKIPIGPPAPLTTVATLPTSTVVMMKPPVNKQAAEGQPTAPPKHTASPEQDNQGSGLIFGWVKGGSLFSKVAEKTKTMTETMITTLDPQMREFIYSGGDIEIVVASDKDAKVSPLREAFQKVFGHATVYGLQSQATSVADQPVGFAAALNGCNERIKNLRSGGQLAEDQVLVAVEGFLLEVGDNSWVDMACLVLSDPMRKISIKNFSQPTPVEAQYVDALKQKTPDSYPKRYSGLSAPIGSVIGEQMNIPHNKWHEAICGVTRKDILHLAGLSLAGMYKRALAAKVDTV